MTVTKSKDADERKITIAEVEAFIQCAAVMLKEYVIIVKQLGEVGKNDGLGIHFAKELHAKKEKAQRKLQVCFKQLDGYQKWVMEEIRRCEHNLSVISANKSGLKTDGAIAKFDAADSKLASIYKKLQELLEKIEILFKEIQGAFIEGMQKQFTGKIPEEYPYFRVPPQGQNTTLSSLDQRLKKIISMGPID